MEFKLSNHKRDCRGFTLVEMMVGVSIGCLLLAALATLYMFSMRSFASVLAAVRIAERVSQV